MSIHHTTPFYHRKLAEKCAAETAAWEAAGNTITQLEPWESKYNTPATDWMKGYIRSAEAYDVHGKRMTMTKGRKTLLEALVRHGDWIFAHEAARLVNRDGKATKKSLADLELMGFVERSEAKVFCADANRPLWQYRAKSNGSA